MTELLGIRAYARRRNVSHTAVRKAIESNRLVEAVSRTPAGDVRIDPEVADREWRSNTDPAQQREAPALEVDPETGQASLPGMGAPGRPRKDAPEDPARKAFATSRAVRENASARLAMLELEIRTGQLVRIDDVIEAAASAGRRVHDALRNIPARVSGEVASIRNVRDVHALLDREIARVLTNLATELEGVGRDLAARSKTGRR